MFTAGAILLIAVVAICSAIGAIKGGVFWDSVFEVLGHILLIVIEFVLIFGFIIWIIGNMINVW